MSGQTRLPTSARACRFAPGALFAAGAPLRRIGTLPEVVAARHAPDTLILGARIERQFRGEEAGGMARAGHIPGSVNVPFTQTFAHRTQAILPAEELRALYERAGVFNKRRVITTCGAGVAAAGAMFCLALIGYDSVAVYDGSWDEWSKHPELPAAKRDE